MVSAGYCTMKRTSGFAACSRCTSEASVVAPVLVVRSATILKPAFSARSSAILRLSWQKRLSQVKSAIVFRSLGPPLLRPLLQELNTLATMVLSCGPVRKNHLKLFSVRVGEAQGWQRHRDAVALHERLDDRGVAARALAVEPVHLVHGDELLGEGAGQIAAALVVAHDQLHWAPPSPEKPLPGPRGTLRSG